MDMWIQDMRYGSIKIGGKAYCHDVVVHRNGSGSSVNECANAISGICNSSHKITLDQAKKIWKDGMKWLIIGTGYFDKLGLSSEVVDFFLDKGCKVSVVPTPIAVRVWNRSKGKALGLFHTTF